MSFDGEVCFDLQQPMIGKAAGSVCVSPFGEIRVEHRLLRAPVVFSGDRVQVVLEPGPADDDLTLKRDPVILHLQRDAFTPANVGFVFKAPVRVGPFRFGAQRVIPLRWSQRRHGLDVDVLTLTVAEPVLLVAGLSALGIAASNDIGRSVGAAIGSVPLEVAAEVREARRQRQRRSAWKVLGVGLAIAALMGAATSGWSSWQAIARPAVASSAAALLVGLAFGGRLTRLGGESFLGRWGGPLFGALAGAFALGGAMVPSPSMTGARYLLMWSLLAGAVGGVIVAAGVRGIASTPPHRTVGDPLALPPRSRLLVAVPIALLSIAVIAGAAAWEELVAQVVRDVQGALVAEDDLTGWTKCCDSDGVLRGALLDQHICGGDDGALRAHLAGVRRSFNRLTPGHPDLASVHFDLTVLLAPTEAEAEREFAAIYSPNYVTCTEVSLGKRAREFQSGATDLADAEFEGRQRLDGLSDLVIDRFHVRVPLNGTFDAMTGYFVRARVGRTIIRMPILEYVTGALGEGELEALVRSVVAKVDAADL